MGYRSGQIIASKTDDPIPRGGLVRELFTNAPPEIEPRLKNPKQGETFSQFGLLQLCTSYLIEWK